VTWKAIDDGATIGTEGSESGRIIRGEEHVSGARITLEEDATIAPFGITCGIYGNMVHTTWAGNRPEADKLFENMKTALSRLIDMPFDTDAEKQAYYDTVDAFVRKY
jgi:hypothetical protein